MKNKVIIFLISFLAPGAGHFAKGRFGRGIGFAVFELLWGAVSGPLVLLLIAKMGNSTSLEYTGLYLIFAQIIPVAIFGLVALVAAFDAASIPETEAYPNFIAGCAAFAAFWLLYLAINPALNKAAMSALLGPEAADVLNQAAAGQAAADQVAKEIESLPPGPFAGETKKETFVTRENDTFKLPANYLAEPGPSTESPEGQEIRLYPGAMQKDFVTGNRTLKEMMAGGLIFLEVQPVPENMRSPGEFAAYYEKMMRRNVTKNNASPAQRGTVEQKEGFPLPAVLVSMDSYKLIQFYMFGKERYFRFKTYEWTPVLDGIARSLKEAPPQPKGKR